MAMAAGFGSQQLMTCERAKWRDRRAKMLNLNRNLWRYRATEAYEYSPTVRS